MKQDKVVSQVLGDEITLSPSDLLNQKFARARFGGYKRRQVDDFMERVADVMEGLINQVRILRERNDEQRRTIEEFREIEASLRNTLLASQRHGEQMVESARREAALILEEAKMKRVQAQADASKLPSNLARDIHLLEQQRSRLRTELLAILETHRRLIDSLVPEEPAPMPAGFFEVGAIHALTAELPMSFENESMPAANDAADSPAVREPAATAKDLFTSDNSAAEMPIAAADDDSTGDSNE